VKLSGAAGIAEPGRPPTGGAGFSGDGRAGGGAAAACVAAAGCVAPAAQVIAHRTNAIE